MARVCEDSVLGYYSADTIEQAQAKLEKCRNLALNKVIRVDPQEIQIYKVTTTTKRELLDPSVLKV